MTVSSSSAEAVRCSAWARQEGLDPVGSAGSYNGFLLVESPLPWPRDVGEMAGVAAVGDLVTRDRLRVQALVANDLASHSRRVITYTAPPSVAPAHRRFARNETSVDAGGDLRAVVEALLEGPRDEIDGVRDLLVCTHGRRDVCCGSLGMDLVARLAQSGVPDGVNLWRTSHTGGHRFAPTFIVLPEATAWAYADADLVTAVLNRSGRAADVADRYRGCSGLGSPRIQALEREVLRSVGWDLLDRPRLGIELDDGLTVELDVGHPVDGVERWQASVTPGRLMPVPDCLHPIDAARKAEYEWVVTDLRRLGPQSGGHEANTEGIQG